MRKLLLVTSVLLAACGGSDSTSPSSADVTGSYALWTVNGSPLPFTFQSGATTVVVTEDMLTVASDGSWSQTAGYRQIINGQASTGTTTDGGTWVRAGSAVTLSSPISGGGYFGSYSSNTLKLTDPSGFIYVLKR
jgi:hypothetical protein